MLRKLTISTKLFEIIKDIYGIIKARVPMNGMRSESFERENRIK